MALENLVGPDIFIDNLVRTNPAVDDPVSQGQGHLTGIKNSLLNSFPNITAAVTASVDQLNGVSPVFTGTPTAPTAANGTNTTQIATTAYVLAQLFVSQITQQLGYSQTWTNVTASRASGNNYTNGTGRPIQILFRLSSASSSTLSFTVNGQAMPSLAAVGGAQSISFIVPPTQTYSVTWTNGASVVWTELR